MAVARREWKVHPHGELAEVEDNILTVTGTISMPAGRLPRRMTVVRTRAGQLVIFSAMSLTEDQMAVLESYGEPTYMIIPNDHHRLDARSWKERYPAIRVIAPAGAREKVEKVVLVDSTFGDFGDPTVRFVPVSGTAEKEAALEVHGENGTTLILNDLVGNIRNASGFSGWLLRLMGFAGDEPHIPLPVRRAVIESKGQVREQLLTWSAMSSLRRILVSHGEPIEDDPRNALRRLAQSIQLPAS
jgi:hypothetical protein